MLDKNPRRSSPLYITPAFELLAPSFQLVKRNFKIFSLLSIFPLFIGLANGFWVFDNERHVRPDILNFLNAVGHSTVPVYVFSHFGLTFIITFIISVIIQIMTQQAYLEVAFGKKPKLRLLWLTVRKGGFKILGLYSLISIITILGLLLIIPGFVFLKRFLFAPYLLLENPQYSITQVLRGSSELSGRSSRNVYTVIGLMLFFSIFGFLPFIGWMIAFFLHVAYGPAVALRYKELNRLRN